MHFLFALAFFLTTVLSTRDIQQRTGWSLAKIRGLIRAGRLRAINSSLGKRATFAVRECDLDELLTPANTEESPKDEVK